MKTKLRLLSAAFILTCGSLVAQESARIKMIQPAPHLRKHAPLNNAGSKTSSTGCPANIIDYVYYKEEVGLDSNNTFDILPVWPGELTSTAFPNAHPLTISQLMFSGKLKPGGSATNKARLGIWTVEPGTYKPLALLSSGQVTIDPSGDYYYTVTLPTPVTISDTFAVTIANETVSDTIDVYMTDPNHTQTQELISFYNYQGFWETMPESNFVETEVVLMPVVSYDLAADYRADALTCANTPLPFTNMSSSIFENRVFNLYQFNLKWVTGTTVDSTFAWDFGDGTPVVYAKNPVHTFTTPGTYTVSLTGSTKGYFSTGCSDTKTMNVVVKGNIESLFTIDSSKSPKITFTNTSKNSEPSTVYSWTFGDGGTSSDTNPVHSYTVVGTYTVTLVATGPCGTSTSTQTLNIKDVSTGINQFIPIKVLTHYDQYGKNLTVTLSELPASSAGITIYNLQGQLILSTSMNSSSKVIPMSDIAAGSYIVRVQTPNGSGATRIAVIE